MIQPEGTTIPSRPNNALQQIQADSELHRAHRLVVANSPKSEQAILDTLEKMIGAKASAAVRKLTG